MNKKRIGTLLSIILLFAFAVKADVPAPPGQKKSEKNLVLETKDDLSDFSFFLNFYGELREVEVRSNSRTTITPTGIPAIGSGRRYERAILLAIPKKNINAFAGNSPEMLKALSKEIEEKKIDGVVELLTHYFSENSLFGINLTAPTYIIEREGNTLKAVKSSNPNIILIVTGILVALTIIFFGVFLFRKVFKKV